MASQLDSGDYDILEVIGKGSFGIIRKVRRKSDGHILCRKEINYVKMSHKEREQLHAEFSILSSFKHPNIVGYFHREHIKDTQDLFIYMEYCGGGDLGMVITNLKKTGEYATEEFVWRMFAQIVVALYRCHYGTEPPDPGRDLGSQKDPREARGTGLRSKQTLTILHRDLKPDNIFLGDNQAVKLGDFGLSKIMQSHDFTSTYVGTPFYMSPEICLAESYNTRSDIWSLGCIMYELCSKEPPFNARTHIQLAQAIKKGTFKELPSVYSQELRNAISSCLKVNPKLRPDAAGILSLPSIWIARKGLEMVDINQKLVLREKHLEERVGLLEREESAMRKQVDDTLRREWEVKARLEIDRQVEQGLVKLRAEFDKEVQAKAQQIARTMAARLTTEQRALRDITDPPNTSDKENEEPYPQSSTSTTGEEDFPSTTDLTNLSGLSLESPENTKAGSRSSSSSSRKSKRTPFARAKTHIDSPADVVMADGSPMSISSLSLSPRRTAPVSHNLFTQAAQQRKAMEKWEPLSLDSDDDDGSVPDLPSPTKPRFNSKDPFKMPSRPAFARQATTATMQKLNSQPTLFSAFHNPPGPTKLPMTSGFPRTATEPELRPVTHNALNRSPSNRRLTKLPSSSNLSADASPTRKGPSSYLPSKIGAGKPQTKENGDDMVKAVTTRNLNVGTGRTLVELAQARAGGRPVSVDAGRLRQEALPVPVWDPERDEMPSPFLARTRR